MTQSSQSTPRDQLARLHRAVDEVLQGVGFPPGAFNQRQRAPKDANARRTTPLAPNLQNEATCHNDTAVAAAAAVPAAPSTPPAAADFRQRAPNHANARRQTPICKTNPPCRQGRRPDRPLTPAQLRALHMLLAGHSTIAVAAALAVDRHTLANWKKKPLFQLELRRILQSAPLQTAFDTPAPRS